MCRADLDHVSHSIYNLQGTQAYFEAQCLSLSDTMNYLKHDRIDLLKLDIEGAEYGVVESVVNDRLNVGMICIEFDEGNNPLDSDYLTRIISCTKILRNAGFIPICVDDWKCHILHRQDAGHMADIRKALDMLTVQTQNRPLKFLRFS